MNHHAEPVPAHSESAVHRIGGNAIVNLRLKTREIPLAPAGISVLLGGKPQEAADQMRQAFPDPVKFRRIHELSNLVASATVAGIRRCGFQIFLDPSEKFPNHARLTHPNGVEGFADTNLLELSRVFKETSTPRD
jgi:hypothetical protein